MTEGAYESPIQCYSEQEGIASLSAHLSPKKLKMRTEQVAQKLAPQCVSYRPLKMESSCL